MMWGEWMPLAMEPGVREYLVATSLLCAKPGKRRKGEGRKGAIRRPCEPAGGSVTSASLRREDWLATCAGGAQQGDGIATLLLLKGLKPSVALHLRPAADVAQHE
jgi:hypothetical protein